MEVLLSRRLKECGNSREILQSSLHCLISKLAHPLEAVRVTALESLRFSVTQGKVNVSKSSPGDIDLLLRSLLEWFNLPDYTHGQEVLNLLILLAKDGYMRDYLLELGAVEFIQQLRAYSSSDLWSTIDSLLSSLSGGKSSQKKPAVSSTTDNGHIESVSPTPPVVEVKIYDPRSGSPSPQCYTSTDPHLKFFGSSETGFDKNDPLNLPSINLETAEKKYLFELSVRLKCLGDSQTLHGALKELEEVVIDFYPEVILQELKFPEILISVIQEFCDSQLSKAAFGILKVLINQAKVALSLYSEPIFYTYTHSPECVTSNEHTNPSSPALSYPTSIPRNQAGYTRCMVPLGRIFHIFTLQLIGLLVDANHYIPTLGILRALLPLLKPNSPITDEVSTQFSKYFQAINNVLQTFRERGQLFDRTFSKDVVTDHCLPVLSVLCFAVDVLSLLEPSTVTGLLPSELVTSLTIVAGDAILAECTMSFQQKIMPYLSYLDTEFLRSYHHSNMAFSLRTGFHDILTRAEELLKKGLNTENTQVNEILDRMLCIVPYIAYTRKECLAQSYVKVVLELVYLKLNRLNEVNKDNEMESVLNLAGDLILSFLSNSSRVVKELAYESLLDAWEMERIRLKKEEDHGVFPNFLHRWVLRSKGVLLHLITSGIQNQASCKQAGELLMDMMEDLNLESHKQLLPILPWIYCSSNISGMDFFAEKMTRLLIDNDTHSDDELDNMDIGNTGLRRWMGLCTVLMPLFSTNDWQRYQGGKRLQDALSHDNQWLNYYRFTNPDTCIKRPTPACCKDPFHHCLFHHEDVITDKIRPQILEVGKEEPCESIFFKKRSMEDLLSIFRDKSNGPQVRRSAIQQLIRLFDDSPTLPPFAKVEVLIEDLLVEIIRGIKHKPTPMDSEDFPQGYEMNGADYESLACLSLLNRLTTIPAADGASKVHELLINNPEKFIEPLLLLIFHPSLHLRSELADFLSFLLFSSDVLYTGLKEVKILHQKSVSKEDMYYWDNRESVNSLSFFVPLPFFNWYIFPCKATPVKMCNFQEAFQYSLDESFVRFRASQLEIIPDGADEAFKMLNGKRRSDLTVLELQTLTTLEALCPKIIIQTGLRHLDNSKTHEKDLGILKDLERLLVHGPEIGELLAKAQWMEVCQRFFNSPKSDKALTVLLKAIKLLELLVLTPGCNGEALLFLASISRTTLVPLLSDCISLFGAHSAIITNPAEVEYAILHFLVSLLECAADHNDAVLCSKITCLLSKGTVFLPALRFMFNKSSQPCYVSTVLAVQCISRITKLVSQDAQSEISVELVEIIIPLVTFLARFCSKDRVSLRHKQLVREVLNCLWCITFCISPHIWEKTWANAGTAFWFSKLANDPEARVRGMSFAIIAQLATKWTPLASDWLKHNWPDFQQITIQTSLSRSECYAVRQECLRFVLANLHPSFPDSSRSSLEEDHEDISEIYDALERNNFWEKLPEMLTEKEAALSFRAVVIEILVRGEKNSLNQPRFLESLLQQFSVFDAREENHLTGHEWNESYIHTCHLVARAAELLGFLAQVHDPQLDVLIYSIDTVTKLSYIFCYLSELPLSSHCADCIYNVATALNLISFELLQTGRYNEHESVVVNDGNTSLLQRSGFEETVEKRDLFDEMLESCGQRLFKDSLTVLKKSSRLNMVNAESMKSWSWKVRMAVCALMCTLLSEGRDLLLGDTDDQLILDICESLFLELEDTYAFSRTANFPHYDILPGLLAVGTALQNLLAYSKKAKNATLKLFGPRRLITMAYEARSHVFDRGTGTLMTCHQLHLESYNTVIPTMELHTGVFPDNPGGIEHTLRRRRMPEGPASDTLSKSLKLFIHRILILSLRLMKNLAYNSPEAAESCIEFGCLELARSIWRCSSTSHDENMLHELLGLLCNLAAQSDSAKDIIAAEDGQSGKTDLMTQVCSLITQPTLDKSSYLLAIGLLQSLMTRCETRAAFLRKKQLPIILKQLSISLRTKDTSRQHILLQLLVNITGHPYGQHMILKDLSQEPYFDMVLDLIEKGTHPAKTAIFLLRNLAFSRESRPFFLLNNRTIMLLTACTQSENIEMRAYAASAIWVLIAHGHKIAKALRRLGSLPLLAAAEERTRKELQNSTDKNPLLLHAYQCLSSINQLAGECHQPILHYEQDE